MPKVDFKKTLKHIYNAPTNKPSMVEIPKMNYLMVDGKGLPGEQNFIDACGTIFPVAFVAKFIAKAKWPEKDYVVPPLEVKWKLDRSQAGSKRFCWTMMVMQPEHITKDLISQATSELKRKKKELPLGSSLRSGTLEEGLCAQILHKGPYGKPMDETFAILKSEMEKLGYDHENDSHDIYFNDSRKVKPEKLKTLIRVKIWK